MRGRPACDGDQPCYSPMACEAFGHCRLRNFDPVVSHHYYPSTMHMGDCSICGNAADHPNHIKPPQRAKDLFG